MVAAAAYYLFAGYYSILHTVHQRPAYASAAPGVDKPVLGACIEGVFSVHEFGMEYHVPLLAGALKVGQAFPGEEIPGADYSRRRHCRRQVGRVGTVLAFDAEDAIDPTVLVGCEAHIIDIGRGLSPFRDGDRAGPEPEIINSIGTLRHRKEGFPVIPFDSGYQQVTAVPLDGAGIHNGVDANAFHQEGIGLGIQVVTPL